MCLFAFSPSPSSCLWKILPRHLDKNVTLVGRVIKGMELLSSLPRGTGDLGFFENQDEVDSYYENYYGNGGDVPSPYSTGTTLRPGDTKKIDRDGDGTINGTGNIDEEGVMSGDLKYTGDNAAHYTFGVNLGANFKNFDFSAFFQGVLKQNVIKNKKSVRNLLPLGSRENWSFLANIMGMLFEEISGLSECLKY